MGGGYSQVLRGILFSVISITLGCSAFQFQLLKLVAAVMNTIFNRCDLLLNRYMFRQEVYKTITFCLFHGHNQ